MAAPTTRHPSDACDPTPDFVYVVSLLAALEDAAEQVGHGMVLPFLGIARAELTDFGQRRVPCYIPIQIDDLWSGLVDLERRLTALLADSKVLQHSLRLDAAAQALRRGVLDAASSSVGP